MNATGQRRPIPLAAFVLAAWASGSPAWADGPSFDCKAATSASELRICLDPSLAQLDLDIAHAFAQKEGGSDSRDATVLRQQQRAWLLRRNACGGREACLREAMQSRLAMLQSSTGSAPSAPPPSPAASATGNSPGLDPREQRRLEAEQRRAELQRRMQELRAARAQRIPAATDAAMAQLLARGHRPTQPPPDATPAGDEWRGAASCGGSEMLVRLVLPSPASAGPPEAVIEFGPGPDTGGPRGSFRATGSFPAAAGTLHLEPQAWLHQPNAAEGASTFGLDGVRSADGQLRGTVLGRSDCTGFRAWHVVQTAQPENKQGILEKVPPAANPAAGLLSDDDCRSFTTWLASGRELHIGNYFVSSLVYDTDGQTRVLGRSSEQWLPDDHLRMRAIESFCRQWLQKSPLLEDVAVLQRIKLFSLPPLDIPKDNWITADWERAELAPLLRAEAQQRAAAMLLRLASPPPEPASYAGIDQAAAAARNTQGDLHYLEDSDRTALQQSIAAQRPALGRAIVAAMAERFQSLPLTTDSLQVMMRELRDLQLALRRAHDTDAAALAAQAADRVEKASAGRIWPLFLDDAKALLSGLRESGYERFGEMIALRDREHILRGLAAPDDAAADKAYREAYAATRDGMVTRSLPKLVAWVTALPPSAAANRRLKKFTEDTFASSSVPGRFDELRDAVTAKTAAYNPEGYIRPDIVMALLRRQWPEVSADGLDDISYFATALHDLNEHCPGILPQEGGPQSAALVRYTLEATRHAVERVMHGQFRSDTEKARAMALAINTFFNRPGCDRLTLTCTTLEDQARINQAIMTSEEAKEDMTKLLGHGCGSKEVTGYGAAAFDFAAFQHTQTGTMAIPEP